MTKEKEEGSKANEQVNTDSPYYLHPSDYPRQMQVNDSLTDNNFNDWVQEMTNFLFAKNKIGFVDGTIAKPENTSNEYMAWMRCDAMVKGWLTTAMEKDIRASVKYASTAAEIWKDLSERFGKESAPRAYELKQILNSTRQDGATVSAYFTKLRKTWDELNTVLPNPRCTCSGCTCEVGKKVVELKEKERLYEFLLGLDSDFAVIRTQLLAMKPTPSLTNSYHMVAEDEHQKNVTMGKKNNNEAAALQANRNNGRPQNQKKTWQKFEKGGPSNKTETCSKCGKEGHSRDTCFEIIGYPEWWPGKTKRENSRPKAGFADSSSNPIPGLTNEQYDMVLKFFGNNKEGNLGQQTPQANMAGIENEELDWSG